MKQHKLFYQSSYDRGLEIVLKMWPQIKMAFPDATLDIAYGWDMFLKMAHNNPERMKWYENMKQMMSQVDITEHGRLGKEELTKIRKTCGILAYPAHFQEISCISVLEAMRDGLVPVTTDLAALKETNDVGVTVPGDIYDPNVQQEYLKALLEVMGNETLYKEKQQKCLQKSKNHSWKKTATKWEELFKIKQPEPLITIYTPTVRQGWWNLMADNLSKQTYKNFEWVIVDDFPTDRSKTAKEYAQKYNLNINYIWGVKRSKKRTYGLSSANNIGLRNAKGELMVFLQDFMVIPLDGLERYVDIYRRSPNVMIAATDHLYNAKFVNNIDNEDWFDGETDVKGTLVWKNVRNQGAGMRESENPYELEFNYCAIPVHIARELNGFWEFYDEGLGFDNTSFAMRAMKKGYKLVVDDTNVCYGINHWDPLKERDQKLFEARHRRLSDPRYVFETQLVKTGVLPLVRDEKIDSSLDLKYKIPEEIKDDDVVKWVRQNSANIAMEWYQKWINTKPDTSTTK